MQPSTSQKVLAEFVGTFTLIFIGAGLVTIAIAHGLAIGTMVTAVGHVSGGHFNPAVTVAACATGKMKPQEGPLPPPPS